MCAIKRSYPKVGVGQIVKQYLEYFSSYTVIFLPAHPESCTHSFCFGTHILNLTESQDSQSYSGKFCNGHNDLLVGLILYSPSESWDTQV